MRTNVMYWMLVVWFAAQVISMYGFVRSKKMTEFVISMGLMWAIAYSIGWV